MVGYKRLWCCVIIQAFQDCLNPISQQTKRADKLKAEHWLLSGNAYVRRAFDYAGLHYDRDRIAHALNAKKSFNETVGRSWRNQYTIRNSWLQKSGSDKYEKVMDIIDLLENGFDELTDYL